MAKLFTMFLILIAIQACLIIYADQTASVTPIWTFVNNLDQWGSLAFILSLVGIAAGIGLIGIAAASTFGFKTDFLIFAPAISGLVLCGAIFMNLAGVMRDELISRVFTTCSLGSLTCGPANFIIAITLGPIAFYYIWTICDWWRGKDM